MKKVSIETNIQKESGKSMIEISSFPHIYTKEVFKNFFNDFENFLYELEQKKIGLFYFGTYPGINKNEMREEPRYKVKAEILGKDEFKNSGKCIGFHFHYSLPKNFFNPNINFFYPDIKESVKNKVNILFNLFIAVDPSF